MKKTILILSLITSSLWGQSVNGIANQTVVGNPAFITGAGSANVMTGCPTPGITAQALMAGFVIHVRPNTANTTTTPTFNLCSLGATTIVKASNGSLIALIAGDYATGVDATLYYTGSFWQLMNPQTPSVTSLALNWTFNSGAVATDAAPRFLAAHAGTISTCFALTTASDGVTALTFNIFDNGSTIFSGGAQTIAAGTPAGTLTTLGSLGTTSIANNDKISINITSGTTSWVFTVTCK